MSHLLYPKQSVVVGWVSPDGNHAVAVPLSRYELIDLTIDQLKAVRVMLRTAKATQAARAVAKALKSVEGARRHAEYHGWHGRAD